MVLRSKWITTGPKRTEFENKFCEYVHGSGGVALASATGGMHLMLRALNIGPGDEVITPSMTWVSTANLIVLAGAKPVFTDVDKETLMVSCEGIKNQITEHTKLIIPVHFAGASVDMDPIRRLATERDILLVEDAAHALGTEYRGERIGQHGTSIFSFHPIKNITTGEGGMVCSNDPALLERIRCLSFHGLQVNAYDRLTQGRNPQAEVVEPGYKYNLTDIAAVLGLGQLARLEAFNRKRAELAAYYQERFGEIEEIRPLGDPAYEMKHSRHLFVIRLDIDRAGMRRDDFMNELKKRNIGTGIHFRATHLQKYYVEVLKGRRGQLPNTEWNSDRICSIPLFPDMTFTDVDDVIEAIKDVLRHQNRKG
jgi:UDP-4-amino-4-deoxy-L-arabinose-oxoglutarate aminotransferase